jgi:uncharacterized protein (TIGR03083 family)
MASLDPTWDFLNPASKGRVLGAVRDEVEEILRLLGDPDRWHEPTACEGWDVRDMAGHLLDAAEACVAGFEIAHRGGEAPAAIGLAGMAEAYDEAARAFRITPRDEVLDRLRAATASILKEFEALSEADWSGLVVADRYTGPLPACVHVIVWLAGFAVHAWDVRERMDVPHGIRADVADLIVPFVPLLWRATANTSAVEQPYTIGVRTMGRNGGDTRFEVSREGMRFRRAAIDDCPAIFELDPGTLVLVAHGRVNAGTVHGDGRLVADFRSLFMAL